MKKLILFLASFAVLFISQTTQAESFITYTKDGREFIKFIFKDADTRKIWDSKYPDAAQHASDFLSSLLGENVRGSATVMINTDNGFSGASGCGENSGGRTCLTNALVHNSNQYCFGTALLPTVGEILAARRINNLIKIEDLAKYEDEYHATILIDKQINRYSTRPIKLLPEDNSAPVAFLHELGHCMGITANKKDKYFFGTSPTGPHYTRYSGLNKFSEHLVDSFRNKAALDMEIIQGTVLDANKFTIIPKYDSSLDDGNIGGYAFFQGENVNEVLSSSAVYFPFNNPHHVPGIPISGFENDKPELSHIELRNSMMSHQNYRNLNTPMEVEIALLQDIGNPIDRKNFYGHSIYGNSGVHHLGREYSFYARIKGSSGKWVYAPGQFNETELTIGLHVYGSSNTIYMSQEILTEGRASAGVRIDGWDNNLIIEKESNICANGEDGIGLLVSYGKNHILTHNGSITAIGNGGIGIQFDFGHNQLGDDKEYRGSFIHTIHQSPTYSSLEELKGPLVKDLRISGSIKASSAAIYISENALVENIHILNGAQIEGDIISNWDTTNPAIQIPKCTYYSGGVLERIEYTHDPNTKLIFGGNPESKITCEGNITAKGAMDVIIDKGRLNYRGKMSGLRHFNAESGATFSLHVSTNDSNLTSVEAQEIKFKQGSNIIIICDSSFAHKPEEIVFKLVSENIDNQSAVSYGGNDKLYVSLYNRTFIPYLTWNGLTLNLVLSPAGTLSVLHELTTAAAIGAPLIVAAYDMSANAIFDRAELTFDKRKTSVWCSPDIAFSVQAKTDSKYSVNSKATVFGIDRKITDYLLLGAGGDIASQKYASDDANVDVEHSSAFIYGATNLLEEVNLSLFLKGGKNSYSQNRKARQKRRDSEYQGNQYNFGLRINHPLTMGEEVKVKPFASYECIILDVNDYVEGEGIYALKFGKSATKTHRINVGTEVKYNAAKGMDLDASIFYSGLYGDRNTNVLVKLAQDEDASEISRGEELDKHSIGAGLNFTVKLTNCANIALGYTLTTGKNCSNNQINANFSLKF